MNTTVDMNMNMNMKVLVTGRGTSGSWQIRGKQLGGALGATVAPRTLKFKGFDHIIVVKRINDELQTEIRRQKKKWVWDMVDCWPQIAGGPFMTRDEAVAWLRGTIALRQPDAIVFATSKMFEDSGWEGPYIILPHHGWPRYSAPIPIRNEIKTVGYEGGEHYLGAWRQFVALECQKRGWNFVINKGLEQCDVGIALRHPIDYASKNWKSNCKVANHQLMGLPTICSPEQGYIEFTSGYELYADNPQELHDACNMLSSFSWRQTAHKEMIKAAPTLASVAERYKEWLQALNF